MTAINSLINFKVFQIHSQFHRSIEIRPMVVFAFLSVIAGGPETADQQGAEAVPKAAFHFQNFSIFWTQKLFGRRRIEKIVEKEKNCKSNKKHFASKSSKIRLELI